MIRLNEVNIGRHIEEIGKIGRIGNTSNSGFERLGWSDAESAAIDYISQKALEYGLKVSL
ncbi:hypothetical protein K9M79_00775 [Candidatus Woesearchaeota archaeon]|nr:hypothetical protein [Candidatus Woesearchaeota archaeon]